MRPIEEILVCELKSCVKRRHEDPAEASHVHGMMLTSRVTAVGGLFEAINVAAAGGFNVRQVRI